MSVTQRSLKAKLISFKVYQFFDFNTASLVKGSMESKVQGSNLQLSQQFVLHLLTKITHVGTVKERFYSKHYFYFACHKTLREINHKKKPIIKLIELERDQNVGGLLDQRSVPLRDLLSPNCGTCRKHLKLASLIPPPLHCGLCYLILCVTFCRLQIYRS